MRLSGNLSLFVVWTVAGVLLTGQAAHPLHAQAWSVQDLRDAVAAGGTIQVPVGTYVLDEPLVIDTQVHMTFDPGALIVANWDKYGQDSPVDNSFVSPWNAAVRLVAGADGSELHGLRIDGQGNHLRGLMLGRFEDVSGTGSYQWIGPDNILIEGLHVMNAGQYGVFIMASDNVVMRDALLERTQVHPNSGAGGAVRVARADTVLLERIEVRESYGKGIAVTAGSRNVTVKDSVVYDTLHDAGDGIYFNSSHDSLVINSRVYDAQGNSIKISRENTGIQVIDSTFTKHDRGVGYALHLQGGSESDLGGSIFINQRSSPTIRIASHPNPTTSLAEDNTLMHNHLVQPGGNYLNDSGNNTTYQDNDESRRPQISWMSQFGLVGIPIHNLTTGEVHFDGGGLERGRVGHAVDEFDSLFGTWRTVSGDVTIVDEATTGIEAFTGSRFIRLQGGADGINRPQLTSASPGTRSGSIGDHTRTSFVFRIDEGVLRVRIRGDEGNFADILFYDDGRIEGHDGDERFTLTMTHNVGEWNVAVVDYVLGATESFLSVNDVAGEFVGARAVTSNLQDINFRNEGDANLVAYISAIPEPASLTLLSAGTLLLMRRR